jgi:5-methylcytosine-specific restriction endonuclease McrA
MFVDVVAELRSRIEALAAEDLDAVGDVRLGGEVAELGRLVTMLEAQALRRAGEWDRRGVWMADGSRSARARLAREWGLAVGAAGERLRLAARLREAPATRAAFARGELSFDKARALCVGLDESLPASARAAFAASEATLVEAAGSLSLHQVREVMRFWVATVDPDGEDDRSGDRYAKRGLSVAATFQGMVHIEGCLDPEQGQLVLRVLRDIESRLWRADHPKGHDPGVCSDGCEHHVAPRSDRQRRADALVAVFRTATTLDSPDSGTAPTTGATRRRVAAIIDTAAVAAGEPGRSHLADTHTPLTVDAARRLLCDSTVHGVVLDPRQVPLAYTHGKGQVPHGLRAAVILRDGHCAFPDCRVPPANCDVHHLTYRSHGGHHRLDTCVLACDPHHHLFHEGGWSGHIDPATGRPRFQDPQGHWHQAEPSPLQLATLATTARSP